MIEADDLGGQMRLTVNQGCEVKEILLNNLKGVVNDIRSMLVPTHKEYERVGVIKLALDEDPMEGVLLSLACKGRLLYDELKYHLGNILDDVTRIQIVSRSIVFCPLEYVYDGPPPEMEAKVCPNAEENLPKGKCDTCSHKDSAKWVCPLHFWGYQKIIERHAASRDGSRTGIPQQGKLFSPTCTPFGALRPVILAASEKAFNYSEGATGRKDLISALSSLDNNVAPETAENWDAWRTGVAKKGESHPKVLVIIPHSDKGEGQKKIDALEIGEGHLLGKHLIDVDLIGTDAIPHLLLLLGCSTAEANEVFVSYPEKFHRAGADIVIATLSGILGMDAVPITTQLAKLLMEKISLQGEVALAELMRDIRRKLLAEGHPGVLGLVSFGDADWRFGG
jgi:hypothetical protein